MGVFIYSNKSFDTTAVKDVLTTRGHKNITTHVINKATLISAPKILVANDNFLKAEDLVNQHDFAIGIGTYFYKGKYGYEALKHVYNDLDTVLKDNPVYGHWAFCIHKNGATYVFNDMSGFMRLYYYEKAGQAIISSSVLSVVACQSNPSIDKVALSGYLTNAYAREISIFKDVKDIDPLKYLYIEDGKEPQWIKRIVPEPLRVEDFNEAVEYVKGLFQDQMNEIKPALNGQTVYTDATGGLDSRLVSCNLKNAGIYFDYINYPIYGPDSEIANTLAKGINRKLHTQTNIPCDRDYSKHFGEYDFGHDFLRQYPNPRWILNHDFEFSGARGECIDLPDIYSDEDLNFMKDPRMATLIQKLLIKSVLTKDMKKKFADYIATVFEDRLYFSRKHVMSEREQSDFGQIMGGQLGDSMYNSGAQAHCYFYSIYNEWHFNHFISDLAFFKVKGCRKLTLKLISDIDPELGSFPFVSRNHTRRDSVNETHELPMEYKSYYPKWILKVMPLGLKNFIKGRFTRRKFTFDNSILDGIDFDKYSDVLNVKTVRNNCNVYQDVLHRMYTVEIIRKQMNIKL